jgi:hypothetical protein
MRVRILQMMAKRTHVKGSGCEPVMTIRVACAPGADSAAPHIGACTLTFSSFSQAAMSPTYS